MQIDHEFVSLRHPDEYAVLDGRVVSDRGLDIDVSEFDAEFVGGINIFVRPDGKRVMAVGRRSGGLRVWDPDNWKLICHVEECTQSSAIFADGRKVLGVRLTADERRFDIGNFESYFLAFAEFALADEQYGDELREHLGRLLAE
jgi:hypothetical protein